VQGDERDVILFSICYGPDEEGKVSLTLGPLTREGGWRRLNVAVSRARYEMKIFSTLRSEQIDIRRSASEGVSGLRDFLAYAEKGRSALPIRTRYQIDEDASFENLLADKIRKLGYEVHTQIGSSGYKIDLGIVNREKPGEYILGILCDGKNYHTSKTARDREIVQVDILKLLGWSILRVWSTEWWEKPEAVVGNIMESIRLVEEKPIAPPVISIKPEVSPLPETAFLNAALEINPMTLTLKTRAKPYMICRLEIVASYDSGDFLFFRNKDKIISQIEQILNIESPISRDLLCKRVLDAWGIERLGSRISSYFDKMFLNIRMLSTDQENNIIFWKNNNPDNFTIYRVASQESDKRNADDLPVEEVANGVLEILLNQISLSKSDLIRETAGLFGYSRIGTNVEMAMSLGIEMAIVKGYGYKKNDRIILNEPSH
jgi:very-short-patch-repair endonuclease